MSTVLASLIPKLLMAAASSQNPMQIARSIGVEIKEVKADELQVVLAGLVESAQRSEMSLFGKGKLAALNGKEIRVLVVIGDFPEGVQELGQPLPPSD